MATEDLILAAALRRDRDGLSEAMRALQMRLKALDQYDTAALETLIEKAEQEARQKAAAPPAGGTAAAAPGAPAPSRAPAPLPPAWYTQNDWWKNCGGLVPGTTLKVRVEDPDIQGDTAVVIAAVMGRAEPRFVEFLAKRVEVPPAAGQPAPAPAAAPAGGQPPGAPAEGGAAGAPAAAAPAPAPAPPAVYEVVIPTSAEEEAEGALGLKGARAIMLTYRDTIQQKFTSKRTAYLSLSSDAELEITGPDFLEAKEEYHLGEDVYVMVRDADMDKTPARDYVWVDVTSERGDHELVPVRESQPHSGEFRGSMPTRFGDPVENDGSMCADFGGKFKVTYADQLHYGEAELPPVLVAEGHFVKGSDGLVEIFARQLKRGSLQRDVLFNTAMAEYELGKSATEMGAVQRGRQHLLQSRDEFQLLIEQYPDDAVCAHATYYLGNIHFLLGDYPAAVQSLQSVIDRWPKSEFQAMALFKLGTCHLKAGRLDKSIESFVNLAYHHKDSPLVADSMLTMAQYFSKKKLYIQAIGVGYAFIRKFPDHDKTASVYLRLAGWLIMQKQIKDAVAVLEDAEKSLPDSEYMPAFLYWHADCIFKTAGARSVEYKKGIILLQRITYDYPDTKWAKYAAARLAEVDVD
jgi:TolA-binding protein